MSLRVIRCYYMLPHVSSSVLLVVLCYYRSCAGGRRPPRRQFLMILRDFQSFLVIFRRYLRGGIGSGGPPRRQFFDRRYLRRNKGYYYSIHVIQRSNCYIRDSNRPAFTGEASICGITLAVLARHHTQRLADLGMLPRSIQSAELMLRHNSYNVRIAAVRTWGRLTSWGLISGRTAELIGLVAAHHV